VVLHVSVTTSIHPSIRPNQRLYTATTATKQKKRCNRIVIKSISISKKQDTKKTISKQSHNKTIFFNVLLVHEHQKAMIAFHLIIARMV
jgi:hypothetical protein